ncbi:MAG: nitrogen fixation protein FixH [Chryseobacterium sp.]|nr:MAG: nitrogen fixation protein FixH [Chryseobacterium sp.]
MNWGKGLVLGLGLFMGFVVFLVVMMFQAPDDSFDKDYYEKGLAYDLEYKQKKQVLTDGATPLIQLQENSFSIKFADLDSGELQMLRPSDHHLDRKFALAQHTVINTKEIQKGEWNLVMRWKANNKAYILESNLYIP